MVRSFLLLFYFLEIADCRPPITDYKLDGGFIENEEAAKRTPTTDYRLPTTDY